MGDTNGDYLGVAWSIVDQSLVAILSLRSPIGLKPFATGCPMFFRMDKEACTVNLKDQMLSSSGVLGPCHWGGNFDPRTRPWFKQGIHHSHIQWGDIYAWGASDEYTGDGKSSPISVSYPNHTEQQPHSLLMADVNLRAIEAFLLDYTDSINNAS